MSILSIDTSSAVSSVAVLSAERVAAEISMQGALTHSETLMPHIETALGMARVEKSELEGIAVSIGPGSFTGLRIGLASAKMMAYALHIPLIAVPTLEALAHHYICEGVRLVPMMDAQKGNVYAQEFMWEVGLDGLHLREKHALSILPLTEVIARTQSCPFFCLAMPCRRKRRSHFRQMCVLPRFMRGCRVPRVWALRHSRGLHAGRSTIP